MKNNGKVTMTLKQLKKLIKESSEYEFDLGDIVKVVSKGNDLNKDIGRVGEVIEIYKLGRGGNSYLLKDTTTGEKIGPYRTDWLEKADMVDEDDDNTRLDPQIYSDIFSLVRKAAAYLMQARDMIDDEKNDVFVHLDSSYNDMLDIMDTIDILKGDRNPFLENRHKRR